MGKPPTCAKRQICVDLHMLYKLGATNGIAGFLRANGALNNGPEGEICKKLIENNKGRGDYRPAPRDVLL
jgi:type I restriction enzyme M protein